MVVRLDLEIKYGRTVLYQQNAEQAQYKQEASVAFSVYKSSFRLGLRF